MKKQSTNNRLPFIDWLRIFAVLLLFPYHTTRVFDIYKTFYVHSDRTSAALTHIFVAFINVFHMPLFFFLAGVSTWFALGYRTAKEYAAERFKRLFIPLVFGTLVIVYPQSFLGALSKGLFTGNFFDYYPRFFKIGPEGPVGYYGGWTPGHLWFILYLFIISLAILPLFIFLNKKRGSTAGNRMGSIPFPGLTLLATLLLFLSSFLPEIGGKNPAYYCLFFVFGYWIMAETSFSEAADQYKTWTLALGPASMFLLLVAALSGFPFPSWLTAAIGIYCPTMGCWFCLLAMWAYGKRFLNFHSPALPYLRQGVYAFFILHQTVIVILAYYVLKIRTNLFSQWLIILLGSAILTLAVYDLLIKRIPVLRFLFGMKSADRT